MNTRKLVSVLLTLALLVSMMPLAFAEKTGYTLRQGPV